MSDEASKSCTAFEGEHLLLRGPLLEVALAVKTAIDSGASTPILVFDDQTGQVVDLDLRGTKANIIGRLSGPRQTFAGRYRSASTESAKSSSDDPEPRGRGRPRLGVVSREVTLLPRHWDWLASQPAGASAALRRLVDDARRTAGRSASRRAAQEAAYHFMLAMAGDRPGYEEATRALFADDRSKLEQSIAAWPDAIRAHILVLAFGARATSRNS